jgi:MSHA biogenesis protein MshI
MNKLTLEFYASYPYDSKEGLKERLSAIVKQYQLKKVNCSWVLAPHDYQLIQTDALPVTPSEFQAAIRWKIKDTLRYSIEDVVIDQFAVPPNKRTVLNKIMVVAAQKSYLEKISDQIKAAGLSLSFIDIPELALRNMLVLSQQDNQTQALIYVQNSTIQLLITYQKELYFTRNLEFGLGGASEKTPEDFAQSIVQLSSEIQRSFDYYDSQWRLPSPTQILLASTRTIAPDAIAQLSQSLGIPVQWLNLSDKFEAKQEMKVEDQGKYLPMIGELFRKEYERNVTTD